MVHTDLLKAILEKANIIKTNHGGEYLCASHICAAVAEFCKTKYTGFTAFRYSYPPYEEERLRYIFSKEVKLASYFQLRLSQNAKAGIREEEFDLAGCESIAALRKGNILSADVAFLCALRDLHQSYRNNVLSASTDSAITALLQETDVNIYDYVIDHIESICHDLRRKAAEAAATRDWKPAVKFCEPDDLASMFFGKIENTLSENILTLKFPSFFGTTDLKLSIHQADEVYYVHDNGCAIRHLSKQVKDTQKKDRILAKICPACWIDSGRITGCFLQSSTFLHYLQKLVFVAQADLYHTRASRPFIAPDPEHVYIPATQAEPLDETALLEVLKKCISFDYDQNKGLYYWLDTRYSLFSTRCSFLIETLNDKQIRISDARKHQTEGEIFEAFYWDHEDLAPYSKFISVIAARFGAEFDGRDLWLTDKKTNFFRAMMNFFNLAVVLSEFGHDIAVPKGGRS